MLGLTPCLLEQQPFNSQHWRGFPWKPDISSSWHRLHTLWHFLKEQLVHNQCTENFLQLPSSAQIKISKCRMEAPLLKYFNVDLSFLPKHLNRALNYMQRPQASVRKAFPQDLNSYIPKSKRNYGIGNRSNVVILFSCLLHTFYTHSKKPKILQLQLSVKLLTLFPFEIRWPAWRLQCPCAHRQATRRKQQHLMLGAATSTPPLHVDSAGSSWDPCGQDLV